MVVVRQCHAFSNQCNTERRYRSVLSCVQPIVLGVSLFSTAAFFSVGRHVRQRSAKGHLSEKSLPSGSLNISSLVFGEASGGRYLTWKRKVKVQHHRHTARTVTTRDDINGNSQTACPAQNWQPGSRISSPDPCSFCSIYDGIYAFVNAHTRSNPTFRVS